jgi:hypothetical protein
MFIYSDGCENTMPDARCASESESDRESKKFFWDASLQAQRMEDRWYAAMQRKEVADMPDVNYLLKQPHVNAKMREHVVVWMIQAVDSLSLLPETLFTGVRLLDMVLSKKAATTKNLQLLCIASLGLASKFHEDDGGPYISDWIWLCDDAYERDAVAHAQRLICQWLDHNMTTPTTFDFLQELAAKNGISADARSVAEHLAELCLLDYAMLKYKPSVIAAACLDLARSDDSQSVDPEIGRCIADLVALHKKLSESKTFVRAKNEACCTLLNS